jgi:hypothetical protein
MLQPTSVQLEQMNHPLSLEIYTPQRVMALQIVGRLGKMGWFLKGIEKHPLSIYSLLKIANA